MEDLFNLIANTWDDGSSWNDAPMTPEMMNDSVARAHDFFDVGGSYGMEMGDQNAFGIEGTNHFVGDSFGFLGFEDSFFNPSQFEGMGLSAQDSLDLLMTHEGTEVLLNGMDIGFNSFQEELCCDYMAGVRAGLIGMDVSQIVHSFSEIPQQMGHADGDYRAAAFSEGVAFANEFVGTHGLEPSFMECLESYTDGQIAHDIADLAQLEDQLYAQECEMAHYRGLVEAQPDNEWAQQQYQESEARFNDVYAEYEHKLGVKSEENPISESTPRHGNWPVEGEYHPPFGYKDGLYTQSEISSGKSKAQADINHQQSRIDHIKKELAYAASHESEKSKISSLHSDLKDAQRKLAEAQSRLSAWSNTKPKK